MQFFASLTASSRREAKVSAFFRCHQHIIKYVPDKKIVQYDTVSESSQVGGRDTTKERTETGRPSIGLRSRVLERSGTRSRREGTSSLACLASLATRSMTQAAAAVENVIGDGVDSTRRVVRSCPPPPVALGCNQKNDKFRCGPMKPLSPQSSRVVNRK